jgi:multiple sugar transport system substrate-binding protein
MENRKLTRRDFLRLAATAGVGAAAIACQPKTVIVEGTPQVIEKEVTKVVKETVVIEKPAEGVKITMYHAWHRAIAGPVIEPMVREFEETHPGIFVALTAAVPDELGPMVMGAVAAGTPPSITWGDFAPLVRAGVLVPLDDYLDTYEYEVEQVYPYLWEMFSVQGKKYAMPVENSSVAWWYHRPLLEKAGLPEPDLDWDWNDLVEYGRALTIVEGDTPIQYGLAHHMPQAWAFMPLLFELGGSWLNEDLTEPAFNSEAGVAAMKFIADLVLKDKSVPPPGGGFSEGFVSQKYGMAWDGPWRYGNWVDELALDVGTIPHPKNPNTGSRETYVFGGTLQLMKTNPAEQDAAAQFLTWFHSKENNSRWAIQTGYLPMRKDSSETPEYKEFLSGDGQVMQAFIDTFDVGRQIAGQTIMPRFSDTFSIFADECWDLVLIGERTPEEGLEIAAQKIREDPGIFERID